LDMLLSDRDLCLSLAAQIRAAASAVRLAAVKAHVHRTLERFRDGTDRTSVLVPQLLGQAVGNPNITPEQTFSAWRAVLQRAYELKALVGAFDRILSITELIDMAGAPQWAHCLRTELSGDGERLLRSGWREAWDHAAADAKLTEIDARD